MVRPHFYPDSLPHPHVDDGKTDEEPEILRVHRELDEYEQRHVGRLRKLHGAFDVHSSRSLDHYFHKELTTEELFEANAEQVFSRYLFYSDPRLHGVGSESRSLDIHKASWMSWAMAVFARRDKNIAQGRISKGFEDSPAIEKQAHNNYEEMETPTGGSILDDTSKPDELQLRQQILVVPELWLWKFDSKCSWYLSIPENSQDNSRVPKADLRPLDIIFVRVAIP